MTVLTQQVTPIPQDSLAAAVIRSQAAAAELVDLDRLKHAAAMVIDAVVHLGCDAVVAANAKAERVVTAASLLSNGQVHQADAAANKVVVVDVGTVTGAETRACATRMRDGGASWVGAVILDRLRPDIDGLDDDGLLDAAVDLPLL